MTLIVRKSVRAALATLAAAALFATAPTGQARNGIGDIVSVEQDWELVVGTPDIDRCSPQVFILGYPESGGDFWTEFLINYADQPSFSAGGVQIQVWEGSSVLDGADNSPHQSVLQSANETVTFTLAMQVASNNLRFQAKNVSSTSFGNVGNLVSNASYDEDNLNKYSTADTMQNSGILCGSSRVVSLTLKQVRKYDAAGNVAVEPAQILYPLPTKLTTNGTLTGSN
ncbi:MAG TPA: hypothetical protein VH120_04800 [Gemmataceae bacterium]|nr:hypothetical protein [Gemmataceae bacterium]